MAESEYISIKNEELRERVEEYREQAGYEHVSEAAEDIMTVGLREVNSPLLTRFRERAIYIGEMLAVFAMVFLAGGVVWPAINFGHALLMSMVLVLFAVAIPGVFELGRILNGQSELGVRVREVVR